MPIKEEPVRIEFQYEQKDAQTSDGTFDVEYFSEKDGEDEKKYLKIMPHGTNSPHIFEVDFFVEVVDFLRSKGVIDGTVVKEEIPEGSTPRSGLPLPKIQIVKEGDIKIPIGVAVSTGSEVIVDATANMNSIPISSFTTEGEPKGLEPPVVASVQSNGPKIISATAAGDALPVINRPVIRTRVGEKEDPIKAYEDARRQRQSNPDKIIKRSGNNEI